MLTLLLWLVRESILVYYKENVTLAKKSLRLVKEIPSGHLFTQRLLAQSECLGRAKSTKVRQSKARAAFLTEKPEQIGYLLLGTLLTILCYSNLSFRSLRRRFPHSFFGSLRMVIERFNIGVKF